MSLIEGDLSVHWLAALVVLSRLGDIVSTRLVTPTLALEANPVVRRLGWRFAWATLLVGAVPYFNRWVGVMVAVMSFFVSGSNFSRGWFARAIGEREYLELVRRAASRTTLATMIGFILAGAGAFAIPGALLCAFTDEPLAFFFGAGVVTFGLAMAVHGTFAAARMKRSATSDAQNSV